VSYTTGTPVPYHTDTSSLFDALYKATPESPRLWERHVTAILEDLGFIEGHSVLFLCQVDDFAIAVDDPATYEKICDLIDARLKIAKFVPAEPDTLNSGVFDQQFRRLPQVDHHVDDNLYAEMGEHLLRAVSASFLALYYILDFPRPELPNPLSTPTSENGNHG
jgi:hypothetical protein